jgi:Flp pilus assembly protein TadG
VRPLDHTRLLRRQDRERGQAMVEFVLVLFPLVVLVGGIIQLGVGIANWHDLNRIANEGARFAATNEWPGCANSQLTCTRDPVNCQPPPSTDTDGRSLVNYLRCEAEDAGVALTTDPVICNPEGTGSGEPVTVKLASRINFLSLDQRGDKVHWAGVGLHGEATMRASTPPTKYTAVAGC